MDLLPRIAELEAVARRLEPTSAERAALAGAVFAYADEFLDRIYELPTFVAAGDRGAGLLEAPIREEPRPIAELIGLIREHVDRPSLNPASPGHLGYIPGGGIFPSALGDFLADVTNRFAGLFFASPGAVRMENLALDWMASVAGYPRGAAGNLTSGGSIANLVGLVTAREARGVAARDIERSPIYLTGHAHHSLDKAIRIAGLRECPLRRVPMDARHRMDAAALDRLVRADLGAGLRPWLVIAAAGTTDTGAVDPLPAVADVAERHGLWFHLDGAYGAFFALCDEGRRILAGMERSDSLVMDPHKGLFLPYGTGAVLVKDRGPLLAAHHYDATYLQDAAAAQDEASPADLSPELTKHFRGLRLWLPLQLFGVAPFRAALEEKLLLARHFHERLRAIPGFEVGPEPDLSVVTFRFLPERGDPDDFNRRLVQAIHQDGRVFHSSSMIDGRFTLRMAALAFRTHRATIDLSLEILQEKVEALRA